MYWLQAMERMPLARPMTIPERPTFIMLQTSFQSGMRSEHLTETAERLEMKYQRPKETAQV